MRRAFCVRAKKKEKASERWRRRRGRNKITKRTSSPIKLTFFGESGRGRKAAAPPRPPSSARPTTPKEHPSPPPPSINSEKSSSYVIVGPFSPPSPLAHRLEKKQKESAGNHTYYTYTLRRRRKKEKPTHLKTLAHATHTYTHNSFSTFSELLFLPKEKKSSSSSNSIRLIVRSVRIYLYQQ